MAEQTQQNSQLKKDETTQQRNEGVADLNIKNTSSNINTGVNTDQILKAISDKFLGNSGVITSDTSGTDEIINEAISGIKTAQQKQSESIQSQFERERTNLEKQGQNILTSTQESRRGFATNTAVFQQIKDQIDNSLQELDKREREALATGATDAATQIANLKVQQLQLKTQAMQDTFRNALSFLGLNIQSQQAKLQEETQRFSLTTNKLNFLMENNLLENASEEDKRIYEAQLGISTGILDRLNPQNKLNLHTVPGVGLVNVTTDKDGKPKIDILTKSISEKSPTQTIIERSSNVSQFLGSKIGQDGFVAPETYEQASRTYVSQGGTLADFKREFPPIYYLSAGSMEFVSENLRDTVTDTASLERLAQ